MSRTLSIAALSLLVACSSTPSQPVEPPPAPPLPAADGDPNASLTGQQWRAERPKSGPAPALSLPKFEREQLANGLSVYVSEQRSLPLVAFVLVTKGGASADPKGKAGLGSLAYELLGEGAGKRDALQFSDAVADLGASFGSGADQDSGFVSISGLSKNRDQMLELLADAVLRARLSKRDFDRVKGQTLASIVRRRGSPQGLAFEYVPGMIYGETHPYGHPVSGTEQTVSKLTGSDVKRHLSQLLVPGSSALIAVGDISLAEAKAVADQVLGGWKGKARADLTHPAVDPKARTKITLIHKDNSPQTMMILGRPIFGKGHPDEAALTIANEIFGGAFTSRLNMNLREDKGYTYGARSTTSERLGVGALLAYALVRQDATAASLKETFGEIAGIHERPPSPEEIDMAKRGLVLSLPGDFETNGAAASAATSLFIYGLPLDYYRTWPDQIRGLTAEQISKAANEYITSDNMQVMLVGDSAATRASIEALGLGAVEVMGAK